MTIITKELENALPALRQMEGMGTLEKSLSEIAETARKEGRETIDLIDRDRYFATALWYEQDIRDHLDQNGYDGTEENIDAVMDELNAEDMEDSMISSGWDCIHNAFYEAERKGALHASLSVEKMTENERFRDELMDYINSLGAWSGICLYCNGRAYTSDRPQAPFKDMHTQNGTPYYDIGECSVREQMEHCNPNSISMVFEGPFYDMVNRQQDIEDRLNGIGHKYGVYFELGHAWDLAFYEE